jgi:hypothetical protein
MKSLFLRRKGLSTPKEHKCFFFGISPRPFFFLKEKRAWGSEKAETPGSNEIPFLTRKGLSTPKERGLGRKSRRVH